MLTRTVLLQLAGSNKIESFVRRNGWSTRIARRFVAGETIESVTGAVRALNHVGCHATLDYLGESVTDAASVELTVRTYLSLLEHVRKENLRANVSVKLSALGLGFDPDLCYRNMARLVDSLAPGEFVRVDMEGSTYTQKTFDIFGRLWGGDPPRHSVGVVVQAYLRRSADDVDRLIAMGARVRLCKGAYKEPAEIAFAKKAEVDAAYVTLMQRLLLQGAYPAIATHDVRIIETAKAFARDRGIGADKFEFQMLYGIRRDLQVRLVDEGYRMRVYVPFGTQWYPYFMRRLAERPANMWFVLKNLLKR